MNEYVVVSFIKQPQENFQRSEWPLHVTILGTFQTNISSKEIVLQMTKACLDTHTFILTGKSKEMFGYNNDIPVTELNKTSALVKLHSKLLTAFLSNATLKSPTFGGDGYRPHVTDQNTGNIEPNQEITVRSVSLVKLEGNQGLIIETVELD